MNFCKNTLFEEVDTGRCLQTCIAYLVILNFNMNYMYGFKRSFKSMSYIHTRFEVYFFFSFYNSKNSSIQDLCCQNVIAIGKTIQNMLAVRKKRLVKPIL